MLALLEKSLLLANSNITSVINKDSIKEEKTVPSLFKIIEDHIEKDNEVNNNKIPAKNERNLKKKPTLVQLINTYKRSDSERKTTLYNNENYKRDEKNRMTFRKKPETSKYIEIDSLQNRLNNVMEKLQKISDKCEEIKEDINKYVLEEINSELLMYISKTDSN